MSVGFKTSMTSFMSKLLSLKNPSLNPLTSNDKLLSSRYFLSGVFFSVLCFSSSINNFFLVSPVSSSRLWNVGYASIILVISLTFTSPDAVVFVVNRITSSLNFSHPPIDLSILLPRYEMAALLNSLDF